MSVNAPFAPTSPVYCVNATTSPSTAVQLNTPGPGAGAQLLIVNDSTVAVLVAWAPTAAAAQAIAAGVPAAGANSGDARCCLVWGNYELAFTYIPGSYVSVVCASTTAVVYLQAGDGGVGQ